MPPALRSTALVLLLALPWLWPFTAGPTAATLPYLAGLGVAALLLLAWPPDVDTGTRALRAGWLLAALASAVIALLQYFNLEAPLFPWVNQAQVGQAFGNLRQPNQLATLLVIGLLALVAQARAGRLSVWLTAALGVPLLTALAATASRVGAVELLLLGALCLWWVRGSGSLRRAGALLAAAWLVYALAALALPWALQASEGQGGRDLIERLREGEGTCGSRLILWRNVLHLIALRPWAGWGWGELDWAHYMTLYDGARFCHILDNAHNLPLQLAVELGLPVALLACAALAWAVWRARPWAERQPARQLAWGVLAAIGLHSLVEYPLWYAPFQIAVALCLWLLWATRRGAAPAAGRAPGRVAGAALLLAGSSYAGWDYHRISQLYLPREQRAAAYQDDAMGLARRSWLFADAVRFAEVTSRPPTRDNAAWLLPAALETLHYSPEPRVITRVIESASLLGRDELALAHLARFRAAFPREYRQWSDDNRLLLEGAQAQLRRANSAPQAAGSTAKK